MTDNGTVSTIRLLGREMVRELGVVDSASSPCNITLTQCHILVELDRHGTLTANELANLLIVDKSAISRTVTQLIETNLINFKDDQADRRKKPLILTPLGIKRVAEIHKAANGRVQEALATLDPDALQVVAAGLSLYVKALNRARLQKAFRIRLSTKADNPEITKLIRSVLAEFGGCAEGNSKDTLELADIQKAYGGPNAKFYVIEHSGRIVGCGGIRQLEMSSKILTCELRRMYFAQESRGIGLGRLLLERCLEDAERVGYRRCYLETKSNMIHAKKLYERFGFTKLSDSRTGCRNGCDLFYSKDLAKSPNCILPKRRRAHESASEL